MLKYKDLGTLESSKAQSEPQSRARGASGWRTLAAALSLANLCYLRVWSELLTYTPKDEYYMKEPPWRTEYASAVLNTIVLGLAMWLAARFVSRSRSRILQGAGIWVFLAVLLVPLNALRSVLSNTFTYLKSPLFELLGTKGVLALAVGLLVLGLIAAVLWTRRIARGVTAFLVLISPFVALTFAQAGWKAASRDPGPFADKPLAHVLPAKADAPRVLWFILDEWDYRLTFVDRDPTLDLPELDAFRARSLHAENAYSPGPETMYSMPAYTIGKLVPLVREAGPDQLMVRTPESKSAAPWSAWENVFGRARQAGFNTRIIGWYHPYCRVLNGTLSGCSWEEMGKQANSMRGTLPEIMVNQTRSLFETTLLSAFGQTLSARKEIRAYHAILQRTMDEITRPDSGLVLVHMPVPHSPHSYDRKTGRFTLANSPIKGYTDSLKLVDVTLGELRKAMQKAGTWTGATILLTTDHSFRSSDAVDGKSDHRIPFLLKVAGNDEGVAVREEFNTVLTSDLLLAILRQEVTSPASAVAWIRKNRTIGDSPYNYN